MSCLSSNPPPHHTELFYFLGLNSKPSFLHTLYIPSSLLHILLLQTLSWPTSTSGLSVDVISWHMVTILSNSRRCYLNIKMRMAATSAEHGILPRGLLCSISCAHSTLIFYLFVTITQYFRLFYLSLHPSLLERGPSGEKKSLYHAEHCVVGTQEVLITWTGKWMESKSLLYLS